MRMSADGASAAAGGSASMRIQPGREGDADDEDLPPDERLDRLLGDRDLLLRLQLSGYAPEYWGPASAEFARYGHDVLVGWLRKNRMFTKVYEKTRRRPVPPDDPFDEDAVQTLATDTVVAALDAFVERLEAEQVGSERRCFVEDVLHRPVLLSVHERLQEVVAAQEALSARP